MSLGLDPCCSRGNPETQYNSSWTAGCHNYLDELAGLITAAMLCIPGNEKTNHGPTIKLQNAQVLVEWPKRLILTWCAPVPAQILETWVAKNPIDIFVRVVKSQSSMRLNGITVHESLMSISLPKKEGMLLPNSGYWWRNIPLLTLAADWSDDSSTMWF